MNEENDAYAYSEATDVPYKVLCKLLLDVPTQRERALFCLQYLACARIGEIVRPYDYLVGKRKHGALKQDLEFEERDSKNLFVINIRTEKNPLQKSRKIALKYDGKETKLIDAVTGYAFSGFSGNELFPFTTRWAEILCKKYLGFHPHLLRHSRATHLLRGDATGRPLPVTAVKKIGGWKAMKSLDTYEHTVYEDYIDYL